MCQRGADATPSQGRRGRRQRLRGPWDQEAGFRRHVRILTAIWDVNFLGDAMVRVVLAYTLPVDAVPGVSIAQWLVVLGCLLVFHARYVSRNGLKV